MRRSRIIARASPATQGRGSSGAMLPSAEACPPTRGGCGNASEDGSMAPDGTRPESLRPVKKPSVTGIGIVWAVVAFVAFASAGEAAEPAASADWPQWRGPNRDGIAVNLPQTAGLLAQGWAQAALEEPADPSGDEGGCGSVTVAGGKAFVFVHWKYKGREEHRHHHQNPDRLGLDGRRAGRPGRESRRGPEKGREPPRREIGRLHQSLPRDAGCGHGAPSSAPSSAAFPDKTFEWKALVGSATIRDQEFANWDDMLKNRQVGLT